MKQFIFLLLLFLMALVINAQNITRLNDIQLPADVKSKIASLNNPEDLQNFKYTDSKVFADKDLATVQQTIALGFSDGKITGTITIIKTKVGFEAEKNSYSVDICF